MAVVRVLAAAAALLAVTACTDPERPDAARRPASTLPDLSGLAWVEGDRFLAVHDSKTPEEDARPRLSLLDSSEAGGEWRPLAVSWPAAAAPSSDLESVARIPGTDAYLLAESGDDGEGPHRRIFLAELQGGRVRIAETVRWPEEIVNVEGVAVARVGAGLVFLYAERSHGSPSTAIRWAPLQTGPLRFGAFREAILTLPAGAGMNRPVSALEVDADGTIYAASAFDPDADAGPFRSAVWRVGRVMADGAGAPAVHLDSVPHLVARADGLKIESLATRALADGTRQLLIGTDDEDLGAVVRPLPLAASAVTP